jgi:hypothetical protein
MVFETWTTMAVPLLEKLLCGEDGDLKVVSGGLLQQCNEDVTIRRTLAALIEDGFVGGATVRWAMGSGDPRIIADVLRLTPKGRRAVGDWPSGQSGDMMIRALEATITNLPEGETKKHMRDLLVAAREVGTEVLTGVITNVFKSAMGLP